MPTDAVPLTGNDCAGILHRLSRTLSSAGLELERLELWKDLEDVRWLSQFDGPVLGNDAEPVSYDRQRTMNGFRDAVFINRTTVALERASQLPGFKAQVANHLKNWRIRQVPDDKTEAPTQAMDHLYEAEVAARLSFLFSRIRFDEPDLVIEDPSSPQGFSLACKRPRKRENVVGNATQAAGQVQREGMAGVVVVSADNIVDQEVWDTSGAILRRECERRINEVVAFCSKEVLKGLEVYPPVRILNDDPFVVSGVFGIIVTASFLLFGRDGPTGPLFMNTVFVPCMINRNEPEWARKFTWFLLHQLQQGEQKLIDTS